VAGYFSGVRRLKIRMKIDELKIELQNKLDERFADKGFKLRKTNFEYVQKIGDLRFIFLVGIHAKTDWFLITPSAFVGSTKINKKFNELLERDIQVSGSTCGFGIGNETNHQRGRYRIDKKYEINSAVESIWLDFIEVAMPFFNNVNSLEAIDGYLNKIDAGRAPAGSVSNACKGLIVAKLVDNPSFFELADIYYDFWSKSQSPAIAKDIITVKKSLIGKTDIIKA